MSEENLDPNHVTPQPQPGQKPADVRPWFQKKRFIIPIALVLVIGISNAANGGKSTSTDTNISDSSNSSAQETPAAEETPAAPTETAGQANARQSAIDYLNSQAFSRKGLIEQLIYEKFSKADATYAVDAIDADWNEQAALSAQEYLNSQSFSRGGLIDQLIYEGFTKAQATYGVNQAGL